MKQFLMKAKFLTTYLQLVKNPNKTERIIAMVWELGRDESHPALQATLKEVMNHRGFRVAYEMREMPRMPSREEAARYAKGTLGHALYRHMEDNALSWELFTQTPHHERVIEYMSSRLLQVHDVWHALLGYGVSIADELAIQAFQVAQFRSGLALTLISGGFLHTVLFKPTEIYSTFERVFEGYQRGKRARFLLDYPLEEWLDRPLEEVQRLCGVLELVGETQPLALCPTIPV